MVGHDRRLLRIHLAFPAPARRCAIRQLSLVSPRYPQPWRRACFPAPPSAAVRGPSARPSAGTLHDLGEPDRGQALIRLQQQPGDLQQTRKGRQVGLMQLGVGRHGELEPAIAIGALIETRSRTPLAGYRDDQARSNACNHRPGKSDHQVTACLPATNGNAAHPRRPRSSLQRR